MRIFSSTESHLIDRHAIEDLGIPGEFLMGNAGLAVAEKAKKMLLGVKDQHVSIVSGKGNNGGDGYVSAIKLFQFGVNVSVYSTIAKNQIVGDAKIFHDQAVDLGINIHYILDDDLPDFKNSNLIIDGLLGTGIKGEVRPAARKWIERINASEIPVLAIDIPSGISADNGQVLGIAVKADATVTMGYLKQGLVINPGAEWAGDVSVAEIGYPDEAFEVVTSNKTIFDESIAYQYLRKPPANTYKHRQGKVFVLAGSRGYTGAGCLASEAALRCGAGLVIAGVPESLNHIFEEKLTEVITVALPDNGNGSFSEKAIDSIQTQLEWCHVVAIGPGFGMDPSALEFAERVFNICNKPIVIDADALRPFRNNLTLFKKLESGFIVTPHYGEASALLGVEKQVIVDDPFKFVEEVSQQIGGILVLKGAPTLTGFKNSVVVNNSGHQGLATGGSGDVLTGMIAGFAAQGIPLEIAAQLGVYIHGKAADHLLDTHGYRGLLAGDLLQVLPSVISSYELS